MVLFLVFLIYKQKHTHTNVHLINPQLTVRLKYILTQSCVLASRKTKQNKSMLVTVQQGNQGKLTFVVQSPDVIVHLVQELRVQQVHPGEQHLHEQARC